MKIKLTINDKLMAKVRRVSRINDKNVLIEVALKLFVTIENQKKLLELWGKVAVDDKAYE